MLGEHAGEMRHAQSRDISIDTQLEELMDQFEQPLYNFLLVMLGDSHLALDCTQDTFLRAYQNLARDKPVTVRWLYTVGRNRAMDHFRQKARVPVDPLGEEIAIEPSMGSEDHKVRRALAQLSPQDREILYLAHVDRFKAREIAGMLNTREGAVRMRLLRANERFIAVYREGK